MNRKVRTTLAAAVFLITILLGGLIGHMAGRSFDIIPAIMLVIPGSFLAGYLGGKIGRYIMEEKKNEN